MNKLVLATAVATALWGAVFGATAAIESQNVVGYAQGVLKSGNTAIGAQFVPTAGEKIDLVDIVPTGYDRATYDGGSIYIQSLDASGKMVSGSQYFWYDDDEGTGWLDGSDNLVERGIKTYDVGEAIWVKATSADEKLQTAGAVANASVDVHLRAGNTLIANPTPVALNWSDDDGNGKFISVSGYDRATYEGGSIYIQSLDASGKMVPGSQYFWYDDDEGTGWLDGSDAPVEGKKLPAGCGIWVKANGSNEKINFPAAL